MSENQIPTLLFLEEEEFLRYREIKVKLHDIIKDILHTSLLSTGKNVKVSFFYQNDSYDIVIPFCLEVLYKLNYESDLKRNRILIFSGKQYSYLKSSYKDCFAGYSNFCNHLFGLGIINTKGNIKGEKKIYSKGERSLKKAEDKFLFSSTYSFYPNDEIAEKICSVIIIAPSLLSIHKIPQICNWCKEKGIPSIIIFDLYPAARKIRFYGNLGFVIYGWSSAELKEAALNAPKLSTPISNSERLLLISKSANVNFVDILDSELSLMFNSLNSTLSTIRERIGHSIYEKDILMEAASLSRKLSALSVPLLDYDKEYFGSMFRKPLSERVDNFIDLVENGIGCEGVQSEMGKAVYYLIEIKKILVSSNAKFNEMVTQIGNLLSNDMKSVVLLPTKKEANAFINSLGNLKIPITTEMLENAGIDIKSFNSDQMELFNSNYDVAILSTYPFLDKKYLLSKSIANDIKIVMYPFEKSDFKFFNNLYQQIEEKFFTKTRRDEIKSYLSGKKELNDIKLQKIIRDGIKAEADIRVKKRKKPKDIISVLTDIEKILDVSARSIFQESITGNTIKRESGGEIKTSGLQIKFHTGDTLCIRVEKTVQLLSPSDDIVFKIADELKIGETLILINRDIRMSLNDLILEKAEEYPKLRILQAMVDLWVNTLRDGMNAEGDIESHLLYKMKIKGSKIQSIQTIKSWVNGEVIGPRDLENIKRIAEIYNNENLKKKAKSVAIAIKEMRSLRKTILLRAKNALIERSGKEIEKLGIDLTDFADAVEFFRIKSIKKVDDIPINKLDRIGGEYEI